MAITQEELIRQYSKAIREGNAAIFGGAGLSRASGFVDWKELLRPLARDIQLDVDKETDMLSIAQFYRNKRHNRGTINQIILDSFSQKVKINDNVSIITRLPISTYWTTNYDELLERGIRAANRNPDVKHESKQLSTMKKDRDAIVYKMHGDVNHPSEAVLTKEDYELYERKYPLFRTALKSDLLSKVFLFIGFSFEDPNLDDILSQIHVLLGEDVPTHYCFFRRVQQSDYTDAAEYGYCKARQEMQEENLQKYGIQTVFVDDYSEITKILRRIEQASKMFNIFISGSAESYEDPWDKNKAEEFAGKLSGELVKADCRITSGFGLGLGSAVINGALDIIYSQKYKHIDKHLCLRPFPQNIQNKEDRIKRWTDYRESMLEETGISIFMFGNKRKIDSDEIVIADGCMQEFEIAKAKNNYIIPIGSTGYAAREIYKKVKDDISNYQYLSQYIEELNTETNIDKLIEIVLTIIKKAQLK